VRPSPPPTLGLVTDVSPVPRVALLEQRVAHPKAVVICVHGGLDRGGSFARLARRVEDLDLLAYDRRGYRGSRGLVPLTFDEHVRDLTAIARREQAVGPVVLFGHSFGGLVALGAAARDPGLAAVVIIFETPLPWILERVSSRPAPTNDPDHEAETFFRRVVSDEAWERLSEPERESRRLDGPALLADLAVVRGAAPFDLATMSTPVVLIHGDGPLGAHYRALADKLAVLSPSIETIEMSHTGHGAHLSRPGPLAALIGRLIDERCTSA
jgi:pimeloyl-ACP methyl ester carboxylesterase